MYAKKSSKRVKRNYRRKAPARPSKKFTKMVQKIIHKDVETKSAYYNLAQSTPVNFNSGINSTGDVGQVIPSIGDGTSDASRIGDEIRAMKLTIRGHCLMNAVSTVNDYANRRIICRLMVVQPRRYNAFSDIQNNATTWLPYLLKKGSTQVGFTGILSDVYAPINADEIITYYDKTFTFNQSGLYQLSAVGLATVNLPDAKIFKIDIKLRNKLLRYDAGVDSNNLPTNFNPVVLLGYAHLDGSAPDTVGTQISMLYDSVLMYEDA